MVDISSLRMSGSLRQVWCSYFFIVFFSRILFGTLVSHPSSISSGQGFRKGDIRFPNLVECINHITIFGCIDRLVKVSGICLDSTGLHLFLAILFEFLLFFPSSWDFKGNKGFFVHLFYLGVPYSTKSVLRFSYEKTHPSSHHPRILTDDVRIHQLCGMDEGGWEYEWKHLLCGFWDNSKTQWVCLFLGIDWLFETKQMGEFVWKNI